MKLFFVVFYITNIFHSHAFFDMKTGGRDYKLYMKTGTSANEYIKSLAFDNSHTPVSSTPTPVIIQTQTSPSSLVSKNVPQTQTGIISQPPYESSYFQNAVLQTIIIREVPFFLFLFNMVAFSAVFGAITRSGILSNFVPPNMRRGGGMFQGFNSGKKRDKDFGPSIGGNDDFFQLQRQNISKDSWAGSPEIFEECTDLIEFFKNTEKFKKLNITVPRGFLLEGPPGCGKTKLAKIIASECGVNFISVSGSDFVEIFVGNGALKVRNLFEFARENSPCVIFIDEIDAVGKKRNAGGSINSNDEREQTLNQLLFEMDGFRENDDILVLAATNRRDVLDDALLRPGRFDRIINVPRPDAPSRRKIIELYLGEKPRAADVSIDSLVETTSGMSGADLKNLVNEAAIFCVKRGGIELETADLIHALDKLMVGILKKTDDRTPETLRRIAIHELGHAIMVALSHKYFILDKISIQNSYTGMEGYTMYRPLSSDSLATKDYLRKKINILFGGYVAEKLFYGEENVSIGSSQDLQQATSLATNMLNTFGFGKTLITGHAGETTEITRAKKEIEIAQFLKECFTETEETLKKYMSLFEYYIQFLVSHKTMDGDKFSSQLGIEFLNAKFYLAPSSQETRTPLHP